MDNLGLFLFGLCMAAVLTGGVFLASLSEAADPGASAEETLSDLERRLIGKIREEALKEREDEIARLQGKDKLE